MNDKYKRVIKKYYEYVTTKIKLIYMQKKYVYAGVNLKYIFKKKRDSQDLIIVFSSCTRVGIKARYNYMKTLANVKSNQLFILDDFSDDKRGSYYLGREFKFSEEKATKALIDSIIKITDPKKIICCGSSKGGYAALNFGLQIDYSYVIAGGPQYFLNTYLKASNYMNRLEYILGEITSEKEDYLNCYLEERIRNGGKSHTQKIYLHYSDKEHTYFEHIQFLLDELKNNGFSVECDIASYENHSDISYYFPDFLIETLNKIFLQE